MSEATTIPSVSHPAQQQRRRIVERNFSAAEFRYRRWAADLLESETLEDALEPQFWVNVAEKIMGHDKANPKGIGDIIEIRKRDTAMYAEVIVVGISNGFVKVAPLRAFEPKDAAEPAGSPLSTKWNVGKRCHDVIRVNDKAVMASGFQQKADAVAWINEHMKQMAA